MSFPFIFGKKGMASKWGGKVTVVTVTCNIHMTVVSDSAVGFMVEADAPRG